MEDETFLILVIGSRLVLLLVYLHFLHLLCRTPVHIKPWGPKQDRLVGQACMKLQMSSKYLSACVQCRLRAVCYFTCILIYFHCCSCFYVYSLLR